MARPKQKRIPEFTSEDEERRFWETRDSTDYVDWAAGERVLFENLRPSTETISLRLPAGLLAAGPDGRASARHEASRGINAVTELVTTIIEGALQLAGKGVLKAVTAGRYRGRGDESSHMVEGVLGLVAVSGVMALVYYWWP
jgi:hypothetical protein